MCLLPVIEYQNLCFTEICMYFCCTVRIKVMSDFRGVKAHVCQVMNVSMETIYLHNGSLSPHNFQRLMNSESKLMSSKHHTRSFLSRLAFLRADVTALASFSAIQALNIFTAKEADIPTNQRVGGKSRLHNTFFK